MPSKILTLSIVIPVYNEHAHLKACLDAIASQTVKPLEVIVVDNNSTDDSMQIAKQYKFVKILHEKQQGVVFARNVGFKAANADIIGRIDSDTILPINWVEQVLKFYEDGKHDQYALSGGCYFYNLSLPHFAGWWQGQIAFRLNRLLMGHYILFGSNMAITSEQWRRVERIVCIDSRVHEDLDLAIHLNSLGFKIAYHENLRVGVLMRRVLSGRNQLWANLQLWPETLKRHNKKTWVFGWVGAVLLYVLSPIVVATEWLLK
jgi:glycosyltransferase involved in cell wall biosynthesis